MMIMMTVLFFGTEAWSDTTKLYVFYPSAMSSASLQKELNEACAEIEVMVFGRFKDFEERVSSDKPDAVLTKPPVIGQIGDYTVSLVGTRGGDISEPYILLSVDKKMDISHLSDKQIGVFDFLGRKGMDAFVGKYINPLPNLKRVSKMEDLLQLLTFNMVEAILIPEVYADYYKKISKLNFVITPLPNMKAEIVAVGVKQGKDLSSTVKSLKSLNKQYMALLEIEQWK